jgi:hypothetical protein
MMHSVLIFVAIASSVLPFQAAPQTSASGVSHHELNFESERKRADELFLTQKPLVG